MGGEPDNARSDHVAAVPEANDEQGGPLSGAERQRRYRARLKAGQAPGTELPPCLLCGRPILLSQIDPESARGRSRTGRSLCAPCWRKSDEGRAAERERNRARKRTAPGDSVQESRS